jgi:ubiquinone biosynthesis protein
MITLEGTLRLLAPDFNLFDEAHGAADLLTDRMMPDAPADAVRGELLDALPLLRRVPRHFDRIAASLQRGTLTVHARPLADHKDVRVLADLINRIILSALAAGTAITSVLLLTTPGGPRITGRPGAYELLGTIGLATAIILGMRVVAATGHDPWYYVMRSPCCGVRSIGRARTGLTGRSCPRAPVDCRPGCGAIGS